MPVEKSWLVEQLQSSHDRGAFSCGHVILDQYLKGQASQDVRRRVAAAFVLVDANQRRTILGYYTLSAFGIVLRDLPQDIIKRLPSYPIVPGTLLGRLAIDQFYQGRGLGEFLLMDALKRAYKQSEQIAAMAVVVDAIDDQAGRFYQHFGFLPFPDKPGRFFLTMKTIEDPFDQR
jgi:GNAT superfamily N-acetyltransferase